MQQLTGCYNEILLEKLYEPQFLSIDDFYNCGQEQDRDELFWKISYSMSESRQLLKLRFLIIEIPPL